MKQIAHDDARINTVKLSSQGQVTLSKEAREQQGLSMGETLIEISLPGCIILLPQSRVLADLMLRAQEGLGRLGLSVDQLRARVAQQQQESAKAKYPRILDAYDSSPAGISRSDASLISASNESGGSPLASPRTKTA